MDNIMTKTRADIKIPLKSIGNKRGKKRYYIVSS